MRIAGWSSPEMLTRYGASAASERAHQAHDACPQATASDPQLVRALARRALDRRSPVVAGDGERSSAAVPLIVRGHLIGALVVVRGPRRPFGAPDLALLVDGTDCLTADVIFKGTVGGTRAPGATGFEDLRSSIMDRLMKLAPETRLHPGHRGPSTVGDEWEHNPFIRVWRGLDDESADPVSIGAPDAESRERATLVLWAPDYDGGNKAWVRFEDGADAIVGGSQVKRES